MIPTIMCNGLCMDSDDIEEIINERDKYRQLLINIGVLLEKEPLESFVYECKKVLREAR
jgi:hypothetical protein